MPLPLLMVPIGIGVTTLVTSGIGVAQAMKASKRRKKAQAKLDAAQQTYQNNYAAGGQIQDDVKEKTAARILPTISGCGLGAAGVSGGLATAGSSYAYASTGAVISGLHGGVATSAKLAWLGGGAIAAGGGGMALGIATIPGLALGPGILAFGIMSNINAKKFEKAVNDALKEIGDAGVS